MEFVAGFFITGVLFLALFFLIVYAVISFLIGRLLEPLRPVIRELKSAWNSLPNK